MHSSIRAAALLAAAAMPAGGCASSEHPQPVAGLDREAGSSRRVVAGRGQVPEPAELTEGSGLSDYLAYAALNNAGLEAAFNRWKAAAERVPQAKSLPDPRFTYRYFISEIETRVGPQRQAFGLSQTFPWFGKLELSGGVAAEAANAERRRYEAAKLELFYRVKDAYYEYYYLRRSIAVVAENIRLVKNLEQVARVRYKAAVGGHANLIRAQVELGKLDDRLRSLQALREPIVAGLNAALNRPADAPLAWPKDIKEESISPGDDQLLAWLAESNPELQAMSAEIARWERQIELAGKDYFPDVTVGVDYIDVAKPTGSMRPSDAGKDAVSVMASLNIPIWWDRLAAGVREARNRRFAAVLARRQKVNDLSASLKLALYHYHDAERKIDLYRDTLVPKAAESVKTAEAAFRAGRAGFLDVIDSQRILLEFGLAAERALAGKAQRLAELEMILGREIPRKGHPGPATTTPAAKADRQVIPQTDLPASARQAGAETQRPSGS